MQIHKSALLAQDEGIPVARSRAPGAHERP